MKSSIGFVAALALGLFGLVGAAWAQSYSVNIASTATTRYLTDSSGKTLYYFTKDVSGASACEGACTRLWPVFYAPTLNLPAPLVASDFGTITRSDGTKQTTYRGWPLYTFSGDTAPGMTKGDDFHNVWYVVSVPFYTVMEGTSGTLGNYLTDASGRTLYYFTHDSPDTSACSGGCARLWPIFYTSHVVVPSGLNSSDFGSITRSDGKMQTTYKGYPLYYWVRDSKRGDTSGQNVRKVWFVVDPAKFHPGA